MASYTLTWNPKITPWEEGLVDRYKEIKRGRRAPTDWSIRVNVRGMPTTVAIVLAKSVPPGLRRCGSDLIPVYCPQRHVSEEMRVLVALA